MAVRSADSMTFLRARSISIFILALALVLPAAAEQTSVFRKLPALTLRQLAAIPAPPPLPHEKRHERRDQSPQVSRERARIRTNAVVAMPVIAAASIAAPPVAAGFASDSSETLSPADSSGAVSRAHVVSASNAGIVVHTRNGARIAQLTLNQFWRNGNIPDDIYDPRIVYDEAAGRWITAAIRHEKFLLLAVSVTSDPTGLWTRYEVSFDNCDYTRLAITRDTVLLGTIVDRNDTFTGVLFSFDKATLYPASENFVVRRFDVPWSAYPVDAPESNIEYIALVESGGLYTRRLDRMTEPYQLFEAGFSWEYPFEDYAPQAGTSNELDLGYGDVQAAVYRGGWLYAIHRIGQNPRTNDENALLVWRVDPDGARTGDVGIIDGPAGTFFAYPSLAVSGNGGMLASFCVLSKKNYPSAGYVYRDPAGRLSTAGAIRTGDSPILDTDRWGDYTTVVADPANDRDFWIAQIYASRNNWQTWWAQVTPAAGRARAVRK
jgi:hypothetical protein